MHSEGNPSGPFVLGLQGLGLKGLKCASRLMWSAARASCVLRSVPKSKLMAGPAMSGLRRITGWGNNGALRAFGKGFVLRNAFRGRPIGSLRPRSSGIGADENKARFSPYDCSGRGPVWGRGRCLWVKYERCVNESVDGDVFRCAAYPSRGLSSVSVERKRALDIV